MNFFMNFLKCKIIFGRIDNFQLKDRNLSGFVKSMFNCVSEMYKSLMGQTKTGGVAKAYIYFILRCGRCTRCDI